ncbi:MAG: TetR/AcrR family transcriptional regulator [Gammaproteobacteria bacterium]|nr:MAG: TetR/AcrR family transcriptional regulator [Gammaproteobacteria bacterium]
MGARPGAQAPRRARGRRENQRLRTRKDLLEAAARLLDAGHVPGMDEIAEAALVSRATAYRYFPSLEALLLEAPLQAEAPDPEALFAGDDGSDPEARIDRAVDALQRMAYANAPQLRLMLSHSLARPGQAGGPRRQNRRTQLIETALEPIRPQLAPAEYRRLCRALALLIGTEAMIVCQDVLQIDERAAREASRWAARALVREALAKRRPTSSPTACRS